MGQDLPKSQSWEVAAPGQKPMAWDHSFLPPPWVIYPSIHKGSPSSEHFSVQSALMLNALRSLTPVPHFVLFCALLPTGQRPAAPSGNAYTGGRKYSHSCLPTSVGGWGAHRDNISGALFPPSHRGHVSQGTPEAFRHSTPIPIRHC